MSEEGISIVTYIPFILKLIMKLENKREGNQIWFNFAIKKRLCAKGYLYPSNLEMLGSARMTWFVDAAAI
ncbi:hypothetical protein VroAM7_38520 [Vibrio rotiferianus]|uniref:Uncharacterized protein n=1 Tax=Vibrio rotiferianus TaxID=190895 RepID=A0A510IBZ3_9VIBR|nr:hypothetical protein VroAM7_38520 [Vibrio rotiferianus]